MSTDSYTELFFLDEATALAAGHRPCNNCRSERLDAFKADWALGVERRSSGATLVSRIDPVLKQNRWAMIKGGHVRRMLELLAEIQSTGS